MLLAILFSIFLIPFTESQPHVSEVDQELMIEETYRVSTGENLVVSVDDADVVIETHDGSEAVVEVWLESNDMGKGKEYFDDQNFEVTRDGINVYVKTYPKKRNYDWRDMGRTNILVQILIPAEFNVNVKTDDGDIVVDNVDGEVLITSSDGDISTASFFGPSVNIRTSDGDIESGVIDADKVSIITDDGDIALEDVESGDLSVRTSDGDISARYLSGVTSIATSDGDIAIDALDGDDITVRTSDGDIVVNEVNAEQSEFITSDGSIRLDGVSGKLTARSSDGNLEVSLVDATDINLRSGEGNIYINAPRDYSAELYLKGDRVELSSRFQFSGTLKKDRADGNINGGRYSLEAKSGDGRVVLDGN